MRNHLVEVDIVEETALFVRSVIRCTECPGVWEAMADTQTEKLSTIVKGEPGVPHPMMTMGAIEPHAGSCPIR